MSSTIRDDFVDPGSPVHNPPFRRPIDFGARFHAATVSAEVGNKSLLAELIPEPLESFENRIVVTAARSTEAAEGMEGIPYMQSKEIRQIEIAAPVTHKGRFYVFQLEILSNFFGSIIPARELFALPMVPAHVDISVKDDRWQVRAAYYDRDEDVCAMTYEHSRRGALTELGPVPKFIMFRNVVSTVKGEPRLSPKLVTPRTTKQKASDVGIGEGTVQFCEGAPTYLRELQIGDVKLAADLTYEIHMDGLRTVHDYGAEAQEKGLRERLQGFLSGCPQANAE